MLSHRHLHRHCFSSLSLLSLLSLPPFIKPFRSFALHYHSSPPLPKHTHTHRKQTYKFLHPSFKSLHHHHHHPADPSHFNPSAQLQANIKGLYTAGRQAGRQASPSHPIQSHPIRMIQMAQRQADLMKDQSILSAAQSRLKSKAYNTTTTSTSTSTSNAIADRVSALSKRHVSESRRESDDTSVAAKRRRAMAVAQAPAAKGAGPRNGILLARGDGGGGATSLVEEEVEEEEEEEEDGFVASVATENSVVVIGMSPGCCMCHVAKRLLCSLGVNPTIIEVGAQHTEAALEAALRRKLEPCESAAATSPSSSSALIPAVFIGGRLIGGVDSLMSAHISGHLIPQLKEAGALWL